MQIKPDIIIEASFLDTYINYDTLSTDVIISGGLAAGDSVTFSGTIPYTRDNTRADIYVKNMSTGIKRPLSGGPRQTPYTFASSETCSQRAQYSSGNIVVYFDIYNGTGAPIVLTTQTLQVTAVLIRYPY